MKDATVPPQDTSLDLENPTHEGQALRFSWEFNSHWEQEQYLEWVVTQLTNRGFRVSERDAALLQLTKNDGGDAYNLRIEVPADSPTHVRVTLRASPD